LPGQGFEFGTQVSSIQPRAGPLGGLTDRVDLRVPPRKHTDRPGPGDLLRRLAGETRPVGMQCRTPPRTGMLHSSTGFPFTCRAPVIQTQPSGRFRSVGGGWRISPISTCNQPSSDHHWPGGRCGIVPASSGRTTGCRWCSMSGRRRLPRRRHIGVPAPAPARPVAQRALAAATPQAGPSLPATAELRYVAASDPSPLKELIPL
jgi:hypothetical protein